MSQEEMIDEIAKKNLLSSFLVRAALSTRSWGLELTFDEALEQMYKENT